MWSASRPLGSGLACRTRRPGGVGKRKALRLIIPRTRWKTRWRGPPLSAYIFLLICVTWVEACIERFCLTKLDKSGVRYLPVRKLLKSFRPFTIYESLQTRQPLKWKQGPIINTQKGTQTSHGSRQYQTLDLPFQNRYRKSHKCGKTSGEPEATKQESHHFSTCQGMSSHMAVVDVSRDASRDSGALFLSFRPVKSVVWRRSRLSSPEFLEPASEFLHTFKAPNLVLQFLVLRSNPQRVPNNTPSDPSIINTSDFLEKFCTHSKHETSKI